VYTFQAVGNISNLLIHKQAIKEGEIQIVYSKQYYSNQ